MENKFTHSVYHVSDNEYYISEYEVLGPGMILMKMGKPF